MTIKVYTIDREEAEVDLLYELDPNEEYTGMFKDEKTAITARAGKEGDGFVLIHPSEGIAGKKNFKKGDVLSLTDDLELEAA